MRTYVLETELELWDQVTQNVVQILIYFFPVCKAGVVLVANRTPVVYLLLPGMTDSLSKEKIQAVKNTK